MTNELTPQQLLFCKYYTTMGDTFSNATISYATAYDYELPRDINDKVIISSSEYKTCQANGSRLLLNDKIIVEKNRLLVEQFNDDTVADARINSIIVSGKDTDAIQAVKHRNDLKQRVTKKLDITTNGRPLLALTDEELAKLAE